MEGNAVHFPHMNLKILFIFHNCCLHILLANWHNACQLISYDHRLDIYKVCFHTADRKTCKWYRWFPVTAHKMCACKFEFIYVHDFRHWWLFIWQVVLAKSKPIMMGANRGSIIPNIKYHTSIKIPANNCKAEKENVRSCWIKSHASAQK